jgi:hypothetical protein
VGIKDSVSMVVEVENKPNLTATSDIKEKACLNEQQALK